MDNISLKWIMAFVILCIVGVIAIDIIKLVLNDDSNNNFRIEKSKSGYDIYKDGDLIWEFTKQNTDSLSLETLRMIHEGD